MTTPKKKKRPNTAQQLIDSLLDERTPVPNTVSTPLTLTHSSANAGTATSPTKASERLNTVTAADVDFGSKKPNVEPKQTQSQSESLPSFGSSSGHSQATRSHAGTKTSEAVLKSLAPLQHDSTGESENTIRLDIQNSEPDRSAETNSTQQNSMQRQRQEASSIVDRIALTELRTVVQLRDRPAEKSARGSSNPSPSSGNQGFSANFNPSLSSSEAHLRQSESLRMAQSRITELEIELEKFRRENEVLASAGETLSRRIDELTAKSENLETQTREGERIREEEKKVFRGQLQQKERENIETRARLEEMENRLENNFKKIRVRERELEHRLEIVRMESTTLVSTKDKMILDLKRQIDQLAHENDYSKQKSQELYNQYKEKQETARRVVRALRIALTILEGEETPED